MRACILVALLALAATAHATYRGPKFSRLNRWGRYEPVSSTSQFTMYRMDIELMVDFIDTHDPDSITQEGPDTVPSLIETVAAGWIKDVLTGRSVGEWSQNTIITHMTGVDGIGPANHNNPPPPEPTVHILVEMVLEFGPDRDDTITVSGGFEGAVDDSSLLDVDLAITGGTGCFLGATGDLKDKVNPQNPTTQDAFVNVWVQRLPSF